MRFKGLDLLETSSLARSPEDDLLVLRTRGKRLTIGGEGDRLDSPAMPFKSLFQPKINLIPNRQRQLLD